MRFSQVASGILTVGLLLGVSRCSPEELVYEPSAGLPDGAAGTAGDSGTGGSSGWPEICGNGIDDDLNGQTDCEDPTCESYACVTLPPSGWTGPVALFEASTGTVPDCPAGLTDVYVGNTGLEFSSASCTCGCDAPTNLGCTANIAYHGTSDCTSLASSTSVGAGSSCGATYTGAVAAVQVSFTASGSCGAGTPNPPSTTPATWQRQARACALDSGAQNPAGCAAGKVCAPLSGESLACVLKTGDQECPAGYPTRRIYFQDVDDQRTCGNCSCAFAADSCTATVSAYQATDCTSLVLTAPSPGCYTGDVHAASAASVQMNNARCDSAGGTPGGCVLPAEPTTVCCAGGTAPACPSGKGPSMVEVPTPNGGSYCIDSTEVTKGQYLAFLADAPATTSQPTECAWNQSFVPNGVWPPAANVQDQPVGYVDFCDAVAFCTWAGKRLCGKISGGPLSSSELSVASQSQWFNACSAGDTRNYPYGDTEISGACGTSFTPSTVKSHPCCQGGYPGIYDLVGNADEWENSCTSKPNGSQNDKCVTRGQGSCGATSQEDRDRQLARLGFRCCS